MGLRKEFLTHRSKTVESFSFVRADISSLSLRIQTLKDMIALIESRMSKVDMETVGLGKSIDKIVSDANLQQVNTQNSLSKVGTIDDSLGELTATVASIKKSLKTLLSKSRAQSLKSRQFSSNIKKSQKEIKKTKNLLTRKLKAASRKNVELESRIGRQRTIILALNRKIEAKKPVQKKKVSTKKVITPTKKIFTKKTETPKKTIIEVRQQEIKK